MTDFKLYKPVAAQFNATARTVGAFPAPVIDGSPVAPAASGVGVGYVSLINSGGTLEVTMIADNAVATSPAVGICIDGIYAGATLPTYTAGDAAVLHADLRGRLIVASVNATTGLSADVDQDNTPAPVAPTGTFPLGKYESTLSTYANNDSAIIHMDSRGRLIITQTNPTTGDVLDVTIDNGAAPTNPVGTWTMAKFESTLPTYANNDGAALHADSRGRIIFTQVNATTGDVTDVTIDNGAAPTNPIGTWTMAKFESTLPTYANNDGAALHADSRGRIIFTQVNATTGDIADITIDNGAAPTNPTGAWTMAKYESTLPTYAANDAAVTHSSDRGELVVNYTVPGLAPALTNVASSATNVTLLAANVGRRSAVIYNDSASTLYIKYGATASATSFTVAVVGVGYHVLATPTYTGIIDGIWSAAAGSARVTELAI